MKNLAFLLVSLTLYGFFPTTELKAQDEPRTSSLKGLLTGDAYTGLKFTNDAVKDVQTFTFTNMGLNPVFLWKWSDKMLFEGEVEFQNRNPNPVGYAVGEGLEVELEYCNIGYFINDHLIFRAGTFFSTMGVFEDWHHQRITNKMISRPIGIGHGGLESGTDLGFNLRGACALGKGRINYSFDLTSGPRLNLGEDNANDAGKLEWEGITDNNLNKAIGGRIGILPFSNSSLEFGVSGQTSKLGDYKSVYEDVGANYLGADLCYNKDLEPLKGTLVFRSQFASQSIDNVDYAVPWDTTGATYTFDNNASAWFAQLSYRPTQIKNKTVRRFELATRYGSLDNPTGSKWGSDKSQIAVALDYWVAWNAVIKFSFEQDVLISDTGVRTNAPSRFLFQTAMGF